MVDPGWGSKDELEYYINGEAQGQASGAPATEGLGEVSSIRPINLNQSEIKTEVNRMAIAELLREIAATYDQ